MSVHCGDISSGLGTNCLGLWMAVSAPGGRGTFENGLQRVVEAIRPMERLRVAAIPARALTFRTF